ncbi:hypothetical protein [Kitasatospora sp. GAS1066B]|uniref:WXG100-like domain-containing protein n=1 Tax=Kitasatospora sp. GAS1066B TaxID=3156271 RepID=UPI003518CCBB
MAKLSEDLLNMLAVLGGQQCYPTMDPDGMRETAVAYQQLAKDLPELRDHITALTNWLADNFQGQGGSAFVDSMRNLVALSDGTDPLSMTASQVSDLAAYAYQTATQTEYTQLMIIAQLVDLLINTINAWLWAPFQPEVLFELAWEYFLTKEFLVQLSKWFVEQVAKQAFNQVTSGLRLDALVQTIQIIEGHRDGYDTSNIVSTLENAGVNAILGPIMHIVGKGLGDFLSSALGRSGGEVLAGDLAHALDTAVNDGTHTAAGDLGHAVVNDVTHDLTHDLTHEVTNDVTHDVTTVAGHDVTQSVETQVDETLALAARAAAEEAAKQAAEQEAEAAVEHVVAEEVTEVAVHEVEKEAGQLDHGGSLTPQEATAVAQLWLETQASEAFSQDLGMLLKATATQFGTGFQRMGEGSIAESFEQKMDNLFRKHLGEVLGGRKLAGDVGKDFGRTITQMWGRAGADHTDLSAALERTLTQGAGRMDAGAVGTLSHLLPELIDHIGEGDSTFLMGREIINHVDQGLQNLFSGWIINAANGQNFDVNAVGFMSGMAMGVLGQAMHHVTSPLGHVYMEKINAWRNNPDRAPSGDKYYGAKDPITYLSVLANLAGYEAPFPVPRNNPHGAPTMVEDLYAGHTWPDLGDVSRPATSSAAPKLAEPDLGESFGDLVNTGMQPENLPSARPSTVSDGGFLKPIEPVSTSFSDEALTGMGLKPATASEHATATATATASADSASTADAPTTSHTPLFSNAEESPTVHETVGNTTLSDSWNTALKTVTERFNDGSVVDSHSLLSALEVSRHGSLLDDTQLATASRSTKLTVDAFLTKTTPQTLPVEVAKAFRQQNPEAVHAAAEEMTVHQVRSELRALGLSSAPSHEVVPEHVLQAAYLKARVKELTGQGRSEQYAHRTAETEVAWDFRNQTGRNAARSFVAAHREQPADEAGELRRQYIELRAAELAESKGITPARARAEAEAEFGQKFPGRGGRTLSAEQQFAYLAKKGVRINLNRLAKEKLVDLLAKARTNSRTMLSEEEFKQLRELVNSGARQDETLVPLTAHALGIRLRVVSRDEAGIEHELAVHGPKGRPEVTVHRDGDGYQAKLTQARERTPEREEGPAEFREWADTLFGGVDEEPVVEDSGSHGEGPIESDTTPPARSTVKAPAKPTLVEGEEYKSLTGDHGSTDSEVEAPKPTASESMGDGPKPAVESSAADTHEDVAGGNLELPTIAEVSSFGDIFDELAMTPRADRSEPVAPNVNVEPAAHESVASDVHAMSPDNGPSEHGLPELQVNLPSGAILGANGRTNGSARELDELVSRMSNFELLSADQAKSLKDALAPIAEKDLQKKASESVAIGAVKGRPAPRPTEVKIEIGLELLEHIEVARQQPLRREQLAHLDLEVEGSVGVGGDNHPADVAKVREFLQQHDIPHLAESAEGLADQLLMHNISGALDDHPGQPLRAGRRVSSLLDELAVKQARMRWDSSGQEGTTDFAVWARNGADPELAPKLAEGTSANCWETVMLAGFHKRVLSAEWIRETYQTTDTGGQDWNQWLAKRLLPFSQSEFVAGVREPKVGQLVVLGANSQHVAIVVDGRGPENDSVKVVGLGWTSETFGNTEENKIAYASLAEDMPGKVFFGSGPFSLPDNGRLVTHGGEVIDDSQVRTRQLTDQSGKSFGRAVFKDSDWQVRQDLYRQLRDLRSYEKRDDWRQPSGKFQQVPWGKDFYLFADHYEAKGFSLETEDGRTKWVGGNGLGRLLNRRESLIDLKAAAALEKEPEKPASIVLLSCGSAADAQAVADETKMVVHAPTGRAGVVSGDPEDPFNAKSGAVLYVRPSANGEEGTFQTFHPRPQETLSAHSDDDSVHPLDLVGSAEHRTEVSPDNTPDDEGDGPRPETVTQMGVAGHPLDRPLRVRGDQTEDPFTTAASKWDELAGQRRELADLKDRQDSGGALSDAERGRVGELERGISRQQSGLRSEFSRFLRGSDESLQAGVDRRTAEIASLREKLGSLTHGSDPQWQIEHVQAKLQHVEAEVADLQGEQGLRDLEGWPRQLMIPGPRDLELSHDLQHPESAVAHLDEKVAQAQALAAKEPNNPLATLDLWRAQDDRALFDTLKDQTDWKALEPAQVSALVLAERKAVEFEARERQLLIEKLRDPKGEWAWAKDYPLGSDEEISALLQRVHDHMHRNMTVATNFHLDRELNANRRVSVGGRRRSSGLLLDKLTEKFKRRPSTLLDKLIKDEGQEFRNTWETGASQAAVDDSRRGSVEEHFGYAPSLRRDSASKEFFQDTESKGSKFKPENPDELPKYAALISPLQTKGVATRYGAFVMHWDGAIRGRVTHTPRDSWTAGQMGARSVTPDSHLDPLLNYGDAHQVRLAFGEATDFAHDQAFGEDAKKNGVTTESYFETQIHGPLRWSDLKTITVNHLHEGHTGLNPDSLPTAARAQELKATLEQHAQLKGYRYTVELRHHDDAPTNHELSPDNGTNSEAGTATDTAPHGASSVDPQLDAESRSRWFQEGLLQGHFDTIGGDEAFKLVNELPTKSAQERARELDSLTDAQRRWLALNPDFVNGLRASLSKEEMAATAAQLIVRVDPRAEQPISARLAARAQVARMLQDPDVAARMLKKGAGATVVPRDVMMTEVPPFEGLRGQKAEGASGDGRSLDQIRGLQAGGEAAVTEENLLGEDTSIGWVRHYPDGYSTTTHEFAHAVHEAGLSPEDKQLVTSAYQYKLMMDQAAHALGQDSLVAWSDGPRRYDHPGGDNYASRNEYEYFAQVSNAYLGTNTNKDPYTDHPRNNGHEWVRANEPMLLPLLERLYGPDPQAVHSERANPVEAVAAERRLSEDFRKLMGAEEQSKPQHGFQLHDGPVASASHEPSPDNAPLQTHGGEVIDDSQVRTRQLTDQSGKSFGRAVFKDSDWQVRQDLYRQLRDLRSYEKRDDWRQPSGKFQQVPWGKDFYLFADHYEAKGFSLETEDGRTKWVGGNGLGRLLNRRESLIDLKAAAALEKEPEKPASIVLLSCGSAAEAQAVADETKMVVHAPTGRAGVVSGDPEDPFNAKSGAVLYVRPSANGEEGSFQTFHPRPKETVTTHSGDDSVHPLDSVGPRDQRTEVSPDNTPDDEADGPRPVIEMGVAGHPLDRPLRVAGDQTEDPFTTASQKWDDLGSQRQELAGLKDRQNAGDTLSDQEKDRLGKLERGIPRQQDSLRSEFSRFLRGSDESLQTGMDRRTAEIASLREKLGSLTLGSDPQWQIEHVQAKLQHVEAEVADLQTEQGLRDLEGRPRQLMIPGPRDLELSHDLQHPESAVAHLDEKIAQAQALAVEEPNNPLAALDLRRAREDRALFDTLKDQTDWKALEPAQVAALVLAERKAIEFEARERQLLITNLREQKGDWAWVKGYPVGTDEEISSLLQQVHEHMHQNMSIATNFHLDRELNANRKVSTGGGRRRSSQMLDKLREPFKRRSSSGVDSTLLDKLINDEGQEFRNTWRTRASQAAVDDSRRGSVEEHFGYAPSLRRDSATKAFFQDTESKGSKFKPENPDELPKYAAMISKYQTRGVATRYGAFVMHWDRDIRGRVTHTPRDSWTAGQMGARSVTPDSHLDPLLNYGDAHQVRLAFGEATGFAHDQAFGEDVKKNGVTTESYFETQVHGPLRWSDLKTITVNHLHEGHTGPNPDSLPTAARAQELKTTLEQHARHKGYSYTVELRHHDDPPTGHELSPDNGPREDGYQVVRGRRPVPREQARPSTYLDDYEVINEHEDVTAQESGQREHPESVFNYRDAYATGGRVKQVGDGEGSTSFPAYRAERPVESLDHPQLRVSGDGSLVIASHQGRSREFFGHPDAIRHAQQSLREAGSKAELVIDTKVKIRFSHEGEQRELLKVSVRFDSDPSSVCRDFSEKVLGASHTHAVLSDMRSPEEGGTGKTVTARIGTNNGVEIEGTHHLADALAKAAYGKSTVELDPEWGQAVMAQAPKTKESDWPTPGEAYGRALNRFTPGNEALRKKLSEQAKSMGVNEEAWARVGGEGYVMQSVAHDYRDRRRRFSLDFAQTLGSDDDGVRAPVWGYHFAPVVIESLDGQHQITLENANFHTRARELAAEALDANIQHYGERIDAILEDLNEAVARGELSEGDPQVGLAKVIVQIRDVGAELARVKEQLREAGTGDDQQLALKERSLQSELDDARANGHRVMLALSGDDMGREGDMWWFAMNGRAKGETLFEQYAMLDSRTTRGNKNNPIAMVVLSDHADPRIELEFGAETEQLTEIQSDRVDHIAHRVAKAALWRFRQEVELPSVRFTTHSLPTEHESASGLTDAAVAEFGRRLGHYLDDFQQHLEPGEERLTADRIEITTELGARDPEALKRDYPELYDGPDAQPILSQLAISATLSVHPAEHTPEQLADLARETGLLREPRTLLGRGSEPSAEVSGDEILRMRDIVKVTRYLTGSDATPTVAELTHVRRLSDVLRQEYGHSGELRPEHLDRLARSVLGMDAEAAVQPGDRQRLLALAQQAKRRGRPLTAAALAKAAGTKLDPESLATGRHQEPSVERPLVLDELNVIFDKGAKTLDSEGHSEINKFGGKVAELIKVYNDPSKFAVKIEVGGNARVSRRKDTGQLRADNLKGDLQSFLEIAGRDSENPFDHTQVNIVATSRGQRLPAKDVLPEERTSVRRRVGSVQLTGTAPATDRPGPSHVADELEPIPEPVRLEPAQERPLTESQEAAHAELGHQDANNPEEHSELSGAVAFGGDRVAGPAVVSSSGDRVDAMVSALMHHQSRSGARLLDDGSASQGRRDAVDRFPRDDRFFVLAAHTDRQGRPLWEGRPVSVDELASVLAKLHGLGVWQGDKPLLVSACDAASGAEASFAADVLRALHEKLPQLDLEAYAPEGTLWFAPPVGKDGAVRPSGSGHLVVSSANGLGFDLLGRPSVQTGGHWLKLKVSAGAGEVTVERLGAHLPVDDSRSPVGSVAAPKGYVTHDGSRFARLAGSGDGPLPRDHGRAFHGLSGLVDSGGRPVEGITHAIRSQWTGSSTVSDYVLTSGHAKDGASGQGVPVPFTRREPRAKVVFGSSGDLVGSFGDLQVARVLHHDEKPALRLSADGSMAVNSLLGEHGEFYATKEVVEQASAALRRADSGVTLRIVPENSVEVTVDGAQRKLSMVVADFGDAKLTEVCRDFAAIVLGGAPSHFVFRDGLGTALGKDEGGLNALVGPLKAASGIEVTGTHEIADLLAKVAEGGVSLDELSGEQAVSVLKDATKPGEFGGSAGQGKRYGQALHASWGQDPAEPDPLAEASMKLGTNQFAWPDVSEAYLIQAVGSGGITGDRDFGADFSLDPVNGYQEGRRGGYHFASVIAAADDDLHHMTLQNYRRDGGVRNALQEATDQIYDRYKDVLPQIDAELKSGRMADPSGGRAQLLDNLGKMRDLRAALDTADEADRPELEKQLSAVRDKTVNVLKRLSPEHLGKDTDLYFFQMYGRAKEETFYEWRVAQRVKLANPFAGVVSGGRGFNQTTIAFDRNGTSLDDLAQQRVQKFSEQVLKELHYDWRNDQPPSFKVGITGYSNSRIPFNAKAQGRRRSVATEHALLGYVSAALKKEAEIAGDPKRTASVDQLNIQSRSKGRDPNPAAMGETVEQRRRSSLITIERETEALSRLPGAVTFGGEHVGSADDRSPVALHFPQSGPDGRDLHELPGTEQLVQSRPLGSEDDPRAKGRAFAEPEDFEELDGELPRFRSHLVDYRHILVNPERDPDEQGYLVQDLGRFPVPWLGGPEPYFVMGRHSGDELLMTDESGNLITVSHDAFAAVLAGDSELARLPKDVPLVLAIPHSGDGTLDLPRRIAAATDRTVYALTGDMDMVPEDDGWSLGLRTPHQDGHGEPVPRGTIVRVDPPSAGGVDPAHGDDSGQVTLVDGTQVADSRLRSWTIIDGHGRPIGRALLDQSTQHEQAPLLGRLNELFSYQSLADEESLSGPEHHVPWDPEHAYFFNTHADETGFEFVPGAAPADGPQLGGFLKRRPSIVALKQEAVAGKPVSVVLMSCESAAHAQAVADELGLTVHAPTAMVGFTPPPDDPYDRSEEVTIAVAPNAEGGEGEFRTFYPGGHDGVSSVASGPAAKPARPLLDGTQPDRTGSSRKGGIDWFTSDRASSVEAELPASDWGLFHSVEGTATTETDGGHAGPGDLPSHQSPGTLTDQPPATRTSSSGPPQIGDASRDWRRGTVRSGVPKIEQVPEAVLGKVSFLRMAPRYAEEVLGMPRETQQKFQEITDRLGVVIEVRPTNPDAVAHLRGDHGIRALPKPEDIKAKTISPEDLYLRDDVPGAKPSDRGLVGFFEPVLPERSSRPELADDKLWAAVQRRHQQRGAEFKELQEKMRQFGQAEQPRFRVVDGVVEQLDKDGVWRPLTGDHDVFDLQRADGIRLDEDEYEAAKQEMLDAGIVQHGAHMFWKPTKPFDLGIYQKIVGTHRPSETKGLKDQPGLEPLLRFVPGGERPLLSLAEQEAELPDRRVSLGPFGGDPRRIGAQIGEIVWPESSDSMFGEDASPEPETVSLHPGDHPVLSTDEHESAAAWLADDEASNGTAAAGSAQLTGSEEAGQLVALDGTIVRDDQVIAKDLYSPNGELIGRFGAMDRDPSLYSHLLKLDTYEHRVHPQLATGLVEKVPYEPKNTVFYVTHAGKLGVRTSTELGDKRFSGAQFGGYLKRLQVVKGLKEAAAQRGQKPELVLMGCEAASVARDVSAASGLKVHAPTHLIAVAPTVPSDGTQRPTLSMLMRDGTKGRFQTFEPDSALAESLTSAPSGYHPGAGPEGRDLHRVPGTDTLVHGMPLGEDDTKPAGRAYLSPGDWDSIDPVIFGFDGGARAFSKVTVDPEVYPGEPGYVQGEHGSVEAPWSAEHQPYFVLASGTAQEVKLTAGTDSPLAVESDGFAEMVAADPALAKLPKAAPIVLMVPGAGVGGMELAHQVADLTGRTVFALTGGHAFLPGRRGSWIPAIGWPADGGSPGGAQGFVRVDPAAEQDTPVVEEVLSPPSTANPPSIADDIANALMG